MHQSTAVRLMPTGVAALDGAGGTAAATSEEAAAHPTAFSPQARGVAGVTHTRGLAPLAGHRAGVVRRGGRSRSPPLARGTVPDSVAGPTGGGDFNVVKGWQLSSGRFTAAKGFGQADSSLARVNASGATQQFAFQSSRSFITTASASVRSQALQSRATLASARSERLPGRSSRAGVSSSSNSAAAAATASVAPLGRLHELHASGLSSRTLGDADHAPPVQAVSTHHTHEAQSEMQFHGGRRNSLGLTGLSTMSPKHRGNIINTDGTDPLAYKLGSRGSSGPPSRAPRCCGTTKLGCDGKAAKKHVGVFLGVYAVLFLGVLLAVASFVVVNCLREAQLLQALDRENLSRTTAMETHLELMGVGNDLASVFAASAGHDGMCSGECPGALDRAAATMQAALGDAFVSLQWAPAIPHAQRAAAAAVAVANGSPYADVGFPADAICDDFHVHGEPARNAAPDADQYVAATAVSPGASRDAQTMRDWWWLLEYSACGTIGVAVTEARDRGLSVASVVPWQPHHPPNRTVQDGLMIAVVAPQYRSTLPASPTAADRREHFAGVGVLIINMLHLLNSVQNPMQVGVSTSLSSPDDQGNAETDPDACELYSSPNYDGGLVTPETVAAKTAFVTSVPLLQPHRVNPNGVAMPFGVGTSVNFRLHGSEASNELLLLPIKEMPLVVAISVLLLVALVAALVAQRKLHQQRELRRAVAWTARAALKAQLSSPQKGSRLYKRLRAKHSKHVTSSSASASVHDLLALVKQSPRAKDSDSWREAGSPRSDNEADGDVDLSSGIVFTLRLLYNTKPLLRGAALNAIEQAIELLSHTDTLYAMRKQQQLDAVADDAHKGWLVQGPLVGTDSARRLSGVNRPDDSALPNDAANRYLHWTESMHPNSPHMATTMSHRHRTSSSDTQMVLLATMQEEGDEGLGPDDAEAKPVGLPGTVLAAHSGEPVQAVLAEMELSAMLGLSEDRPMIPHHLQETPAAVKAALGDFDKYDVDMLALSGLVARPVVDVVLAVLDERGALTALSVSRHKLGLYMARINDGYVVSNPYHTATHAANVVWDCQHMLRRCSVEVDALHYFALMVAAAVHDFLHPGYTNKFCIEATHPVAITYNDSSPLENFHVAEAFKCAMEMGEQNPLNDLTPGQYQTARELIIKLVMATDVATHFGFITKVSTARYQRDFGSADAVAVGSRTTLALTSVMMLGDIGHSVAEFELHAAWSQLIREEFFRQGDEERSRGMPVSPLCDRHTTPPLPASQVGFFDFVARPLFVAVSKLPNMIKLDEYLLQLERNKRRWKSLAGSQSPEHVAVPINTSPPRGDGASARSGSPRRSVASRSPASRASKAKGGPASPHSAPHARRLSGGSARVHASPSPTPFADSAGKQERRHRRQRRQRSCSAGDEPQGGAGAGGGSVAGAGARGRAARAPIHPKRNVRLHVTTPGSGSGASGPASPASPALSFVVAEGALTSPDTPGGVYFPQAGASPSSAASVRHSPLPSRRESRGQAPTGE